MGRLVFSLFLLLGMGITSYSAPAPDSRNVPSTNEIKQAIDNLGSKRFEVRKNAQKLLYEAGEAAEPFLKEAAKSPDNEIASAAKAILEKFQWGLYPNTPDDVRDAVEKFRSGMPEQRQQAITKLFERRPVPFPTIRKLLAAEENAESRQQTLAAMNEQALKAMPELLASNAADTAEEMLELVALGAPELAGPNYAALIYLRGKLDAAIARFEKLRRSKSDDSKAAAELLVYLYRNKGDFTNAGQAARDSGKTELIDRVLWQASDWKALAAEPNGHIGIDAAYARLAGDQAKFNDRIAEIKNRIAEIDDDPDHMLRQYSIALLLNGKSKEAIDALVEKKKDKPLTFDLLFAQMRFKEALELVDDPALADNREFQVRRARALGLLGEKDRAIQLLRKVGSGGLKKNSGLASELIKSEMRLGLRDLALEHAAKTLAPFDRLEMNYDGPDLLKPIFGDNTAIAQSWLTLFKDEKMPETAMQRVSAIVAGKLDRKELVELADKLLKQHKEGPDQLSHFENVDAVAAAYKAIGDAAKADEYLKLAAEKKPTSRRYLAYGDFLMGQKRFKDAAQAFAVAAKSPPPPPLRMPPGRGRFYYGSRPDENSPALAMYLRGRALMLAGDAKESRRLFELAHWLPLADDGLRAKLVAQLNHFGMPELAEKEVEMLLNTGWHDDVVYGNMLNSVAGRHFQKKEYLKAADLNERCVVGLMRTGAHYTDASGYLRVPELIRNCRTLGNVAAGKFDEAVKEANASLDSLPGNVKLAGSLVPDLEKLGKKKEADAIYRRTLGAWQKVCEDYPSSGFANNMTAWFMANCRRDLDDALKHAKKATELEPNVAGYLDTLAEVYFCKGERETALGLMKKCIELEPQRNYFRKQLARFKDRPFNTPPPDENE